MGKASSAKKISRVAAASGAKRARKSRNLGFSAALAAIAIVGLILVVSARNANQANSANDTPPRAALSAADKGDHWHAAFAVDICGQEQAPVQDGPTDTLGIHTHGDGIIHIHPFATRSAGSGANLGRFFTQVSLKVTDSEIRMPTGKIYREGETTCAGKPGEVVLAYWKDGRHSPDKKPDQIFTSGFNSIRLRPNYSAFTLAFRARGDSVAAPSTAATIVELGQADAGTATPGSSSGTSPATGSGTTPATGSGTTGAPATAFPTTAPTQSTTKP